MTTQIELTGPDEEEDPQENASHAMALLTAAIHAISDAYHICPVCLLNGLHAAVEEMEAEADKEGRTLHKGGGEDHLVH